MSLRFFGKALDDIRLSGKGRSGGGGGSQANASKKSRRTTKSIRTTISQRQRNTGVPIKKFVTEVPLDDDNNEGANSDKWLHDKFDPSADNNNSEIFPPQRQVTDSDSDDSEADGKSTDRVEEKSVSDIPRGGAAVIVNNIGIHIVSEEIRELFEGFGEVLKATVYSDANDKSTGIGKVIFANLQDARDSIEEYNGRLLDKRRLELVLQEPSKNVEKVNIKLKEKKRKKPIIFDEGLPVRKRKTDGNVMFKIKIDDDDTLANAPMKGKRRVLINGKVVIGAPVRRVIKIHDDDDEKEFSSSNNKRGKGQHQKFVVRLNDDPESMQKYEEERKELARTDENGRWKKNNDVVDLNRNTLRKQNTRKTQGGFNRGQGQISFGSMRADRINNSNKGGRQTHDHRRSNFLDRDSVQKSNNPSHNGVQRQARIRGQSRRKVDSKNIRKSTTAISKKKLKSTDELDAQLQNYLAAKNTESN